MSRDVKKSRRGHTAVRRTLLVRADSRRVRIFDGKDQVAEHTRNRGADQLIENPKKVARLKEVKRNAQHVMLIDEIDYLF